MIIKFKILPFFQILCGENKLSKALKIHTPIGVSIISVSIIWEVMNKNN